MIDERNGSSSQREVISSTVVEHLRSSISQAMKDPETTEVVELLCDNNGWTIEEFIQNPHEFTTMEVFLLSLPQLSQLRLFPYLTIVKIIHVGLESMKCFSHLHHVEELWLNENNIRIIEGLENMQRLKILYLHGNLIESMENIPHLPQLRKLWLCGNRIRHITGLNYLPKLKTFWIASNRIATLENSFNSNITHLEEINLSNNQIYFLGQLAHLGVLKSLRSLWLSDPMYGDAPLCHLSNYTTFSLRHLPQLEQLDGVAITAEQRSLAISVYSKKSVYYSMRGAILDRNITLLFEYIQQEAERKRNIAREALRKIDLEIIELSELGNFTSPSNQVITEDEKSHLIKLQRARETREVELEGIERQLLEAQQRTLFESDSLHERLMLELDSCGNIRLEEGTENDNWCTNAKELLSCRFDKGLFENMGVIGVKANRVFRIICQGLRERFDTRMRELDIDLANTRNRRALVRLFSPILRNPQDQRSFLQEVMSNGFSSLYGDDDGVPLTNSLFYADQERLLSVGNHRDIYGVTIPPDALSGQLIVSRLFLGKCVAEMGGGRDSIGMIGEQPFMKCDKRNISRRRYGEEVFSIYRSAPHDTSVKVWHMFDKYLVLPEYVIDFTYTTKAHLTIPPSLSIYDEPAILHTLLEKTVPEVTQDGTNDTRTVGYPMISFLSWLNTNAFHIFGKEETENTLKRAKELHRPKRIAPFDIKGALNNDILEIFNKQSSSTPILSCNISNQQISSIPETFTTNLWNSLKILLLQNNKINFFSWESLAIAAPLLERLDLGNNSLERLELGNAKLQNLQTLAICHNMFYVMEDLQQLNEALPILKDLRIDNNPWMLNKATEIFCFAVIPQLQHLNGISISRNAYLILLKKRTFKLDQSALQYIISEEQKRRCEISISILPSNNNNNDDNNSNSNNRNIDFIRARSFEQVFTDLAEQTDSNRGFKLAPKKESSGFSIKGTRSFCFRLSLTRDLLWISLLPQLRHLSLTSHLIEDISPLSELKHLKTLNLSDNIIKSVKLLSCLKLVVLDLSRNMLNSTEGLERLTELRFLSINHNSITDVSPLQNCISLEEFYFAENLIAEVRELYPLHNLPKLVSMDVAGNPCTGSGNNEHGKEYRDYLVYNLPKLKVLDGVPIGEVDQQRAREVFAGRVNSELLAERVGATNQWSTIHEIDLSQCGLREVMMMESFTLLKVLHLHHNNLARIDGLLPLHNLVALNLSHNKLGQCPVGESLRHLENLRSLSLESNHITDITILSLELPRLKFLNLKGNDITSIDQGLQGLIDLRELLLDHNKLRALGPDCFSNNLQLTDISAEENYIRTTEGLQPLTRLEMLSLGSNRLSDLRALLFDLRNACCLVRVTLVGNAIARRTPYRATTIAALPALTVLDNREVTGEERERAEVLRAAECAAPHNIILDPAFTTEAVTGGGALPPPSQPQVQQGQQHGRFQVGGVSARPLQLPAYKNTRSQQQMREHASKGGFVPRIQGGR